MQVRRITSGVWHWGFGLPMRIGRTGTTPANAPRSAKCWRQISVKMMFSLGTVTLRAVSRVHLDLSGVSKLDAVPAERHREQTERRQQPEDLQFRRQVSIICKMKGALSPTAVYATAGPPSLWRFLQQHLHRCSLLIAAPALRPPNWSWSQHWAFGAAVSSQLLHASRWRLCLAPQQARGRAPWVSFIVGGTGTR